MDRQGDADAPAPGGQTGRWPDQPSQVDPEHLAERVYQLMLAEARLSRARGQLPPQRERR